MLASSTFREPMVLLTLMGVLVTAILGVWQLWQSNQERRHELRLRQASAAERIVQEIFSQPDTRSALRMLDWKKRRFTDGGLTHHVEQKHLKAGLAVNPPAGGDSLEFDDTERFVRDSFEALFDRLDNIQHFIAIGYLNAEDVLPPLSYYIKKMAGNEGKKLFEPFLRAYGYERTLRLFEEVDRLGEQASGGKSVAGHRTLMSPR